MKTLKVAIVGCGRIADAHVDTCHAWADEREGPTLLVATDPAVGITGEHVETLLSWGRAASG